MNDFPKLRVRTSPSGMRWVARILTTLYAQQHPEFQRVLTAGERREQYADHYARTIMRLTA